MLDNYVIAIRSDVVDQVSDMPNIADNVARAINKTINWARTQSAREIREQVNLPAAYLSGTNGRLTITQFAAPTDLTAAITGRHRPTSLARFATNPAQKRTPGARVTVQPGLSRYLPRAFFIPLKSGNTDTLGNMGLAIRLPVGVTPNKAYRPKSLGRGTWLLYGPSVDQVFDDVATEISPAALDYLETEFLRLMDAGI